MSNVDQAEIEKFDKLPQPSKESGSPTAFVNGGSGDSDPASDPNDTHGSLICLARFSSDIMNGGKGEGSEWRQRLVVG